MVNIKINILRCTVSKISKFLKGFEGKKKKIRIFSLWGQLWTRDLLASGHNVRTLKLVSAVPPKYWYSLTTLNTVTTQQTIPNLNLHANVQECILLVKIDVRDSVIAIATRHGLLARVLNPVGSRISATVQTGHEAQMGKGALYRVYRSRGVRLTNTRPPKRTHV